ncbi:unnamed protein product [Pleuronectes platessa]|uniref:Uncharacterized protein n=1 Tax=Pleuronectes platessa TaxID=8262 RepID=A0A9N7UXJ1_PLEPL|nr:unnamed protein product [Pleuronectes platessa]
MPTVHSSIRRKQIQEDDSSRVILVERSAGVQLTRSDTPLSHNASLSGRLLSKNKGETQSGGDDDNESGLCLRLKRTPRGGFVSCAGEKWPVTCDFGNNIKRSGNGKMKAAAALRRSR